MSTTSHQTLPAPSWARVQRVQLIRREIREYLPTSALELLFSQADVVVEGDADSSRGGGDCYYATIMVRVSLADLGDRVRERADEATAHRLAELLDGDARVRDRLVELATPRVAEMLGTAAGDLRIALEPAIRVDGVAVQLDGDLTVTARATRRARG